MQKSGKNGLNSFKLFFAVTVALLLEPRFLFGRWATLADSGAVSQFERYETHINADGTYRYTRENILEIRNEEGRKIFGTGIIKYNSRASKVTGVEAKTINSDSEIPVAKEYIEDKPIASSAEGFDETRQISIAYPKVEIGSKLYLKYSSTATEVAIPNFFSDEIYYGSDYLENASESVFWSPMPLYIHKNDPSDRLDIKEERDGKLYKLTIKLKGPVYSKVIDEEDAFLSHKKKTWVAISTSRNYADLARAMAKDYEKALSVPKLPAPFEKIYLQAQKARSLVDKINTVTSLLADEVRYLGDWRPTRGGHLPRPIEAIASTKFGDCKDFSLVTAAILRRLGLSAEIAWVERGIRPTPFPDVALDAAFNHAIVHLTVDGKERWIDPTNFVSFAQGIFEDILDRPALVISASTTGLSRIPSGKPSDSVLKKDLEYELMRNGDATVKALLQYRGRSATAIAGITRELSKESINHLISKAVAEENYVQWSEIEDYDLSSRIAQDVTFKIKVGVKNFALKTTAGNAYQLSRNDLGKVIDLEPKDRISDLFLGSEEEEVRTSRLSGVTLVGTKPKGCELSSPWLKVSRKFSTDARGVLVRDEKVVLKPIITAEELKSEAFEKFQSQLQDCLHQIALVFKNKK